jgi:hypothetical protein
MESRLRSSEDAGLETSGPSEMNRAAIAPRLLGHGAMAAPRAHAAHMEYNVAAGDIFLSVVEIPTVLAVGGLPC